MSDTIDLPPSGGGGGAGTGLTDTQLRATPVEVSFANEVEIKNDSGNPVPISATALPLPNTAATSTLQVVGNSALNSVDSKIPANLTVTATRLLVDSSGVTQPVSGTFYPATQPVSGTVAVSNFPATQPVSGTFFQATQPISAASMPLPVGAASATNQVTEIATLNNIVTNTSALLSRQTYVAAVTGFQSSSISTSQVATDLGLLYSDIMAVPVTNSLHPLAFGAGESLSPGVYNVTGAVTITGALTLNGGGDANALFIIRASGAFNVSASSVVTLTNGATSKNVFWVSEGAVGIAANVTMQGTVISHGSAVAVASNCTMTGRLLTTAGAVSYGPGTLIVPVGTSLVNVRTLSTFVLFSSIGGVSNSGTSYYTGSIGTNSGALTGFETSTITNGRLFNAGDSGPTNPVTDIFSIIGSSTKTIKIAKVGFSGTQTTASSIDLLLIKRSTASSQNTAIALVAVPMDSLNLAASALVYYRPSSPTALGSVVGTLVASKLNIPTNGVPVSALVFDFVSLSVQPVVLRGVAESLSLNINGAFLAGASINMFVEWTEE